MRKHEVTYDMITYVLVMLHGHGKWSSPHSHSTLVRIFATWGWDALLSSVEWSEVYEEPLINPYHIREKQASYMVI